MRRQRFWARCPIWADLGKGEQVLCLPGTHTKWILLEDGVVKMFHTILTGELYASLLHKSILVGKEFVENNAPHIVIDEGVFTQAVRRSVLAGKVGLLPMLFEVRARQVSQDLAQENATSYLSGLLIGCEIIQTNGLLEDAGIKPQSVGLIGAPHLTKFYKMAFETLDKTSVIYDRADLVVAGLRALFVRVNF